MIISLHLPKTAGASFGRALRQHFGDRLLEVYTDEPLEWPRAKRNRKAVAASLWHAVHGFRGIDCIHGHILPFKYRSLVLQRPNLQFITWMRHPADRLASNYYFLKKSYTRETLPDDLFLRQIWQEDWSLEKFCLSPELRNLCSQYLWRFPVDRFDFVGVVEHYADDLKYFATTYLNAPLSVFYENSETQRSEVTYAIDPGLRRAIEAFHDQDMAFYQQALAVRTARAPLFPARS